ncbi:TPA: hypothetical protein NR708_001996 [Listeria innocua]|nr:hypothetical protein [Listeria innocua]HCJ4467491.1 hypothetical protein [Listeria innocua]HCJ4629710.1 hypothetical protein [Listeria innocua]HCJ4644091.1 hypothetical protein [Listeria innocua]HCJ4646976.1 hypothetical protein [Listeria innocua]
MKKCNLCGEVFKEFDEVVLVNERDYFHEACVALAPIKYAVFENSGDANYDDFIGTCEPSEIECALLLFDEGEYLKEGEDKE